MLQAPLDPPEQQMSCYYTYYGEEMQLGTKVIDSEEYYFDLGDKYEVEEFCKNVIEEDFHLVKEIIMDYMEDFYGTKTLDE